MSIRCVVLDFDGTFTNVEIEAAPFESAFVASVCDLLGRDIRAEWREERAVIEHTPEQFGWIFDGKTVAPASADPYLLATATVQALFDRGGLLRDPTNRTGVVQALYSIAYATTVTAFKPGAKQVFERLIESGVNVTVVTNSSTDAVSRKIDALGVAGRERITVRGEAKKFWVVDPKPSDDRFAAVPDVERVAGLERPIFLRRGKYYEALRTIWATTETTPSETLVCGDIYELDLALPAALGAKIALAPRDSTLAYERTATTAAGGTLLSDLTELLALLR